MAECDFTRTCTACFKTLPATTEYFVRQKHGKYGLTATCKTCRKEKSAEWAKNNQDRVRQIDRARYERDKPKRLALMEKWRSENPDKAKANSDKWIADNRERYNRRRKEYRSANKEKIRAAYANWYAENRESEIRKAAERRATNPEKDRANARAWYHTNHARGRASRNAWLAANPDKKRVYSQNRRARKTGTSGNVPSNMVEILFEQQNGVCACCGEPLVEYHIDHIIPLALGGEHSASNLQLLLPKCNMMKGAKHPDEYRKYRKSQAGA